jgi:hypothetical protein
MRIQYIVFGLIFMLIAAGCSKPSYKILRTDTSGMTKLVQAEVPASVTDEQLKAFGKEISGGKDDVTVIFYAEPARDFKMRATYAAGMLMSMSKPVQLPR